MANQNNENNQLIEQLEKLRQDSRLNRVIGNDKNNYCSLNLWLLEITQSNSTEYRLLYGWVIPSTYHDPDAEEWFYADGGKKQSLGEQQNSYKFRIAKLALYHNSDVIFRLIKELCQGLSLAEACQTINIVTPTHKNSYGTLRLALHQQDLSNNFAIRPTILLETRLSRIKQSIISPLEQASGFSASLWNCNKLSLFKEKNKNTYLSYTDQLIKNCLFHLKEETGLDFCNVDSKRLGNIEWLCFPLADEYEQEKVSFELIDNYTIKVKILTDIFNPNSHLLIRCRCWNQEEVVLDQCKNNHINTQEIIQLEFNSEQKVEAVMITVWVKVPEKEFWEIFSENINLGVDEIDCGIGILQTQIQLPSKWLENWKNSKLKTRIEKNEIIQQSYHENVTINHNQLSPWKSTNKDIHQLTKKLYPQTSGGQFFQKGWDDTDIDPGRLSFFEWLKSITTNPQFSKVLFLDPYFDATDIFEVIARSEAITTEYVVVTNTQTVSQCKSLELKAACEQNLLLLRNLKFRLLDITSKGKDKQFFHDRYILIFDQEGEVKTGYHLSNSLQNATKNHPLLITPIPSDIINDVELYVADLLKDNNQREVKSLFSSVEHQQISHSEQRLTGLSAIPYNNLFFAALLNEHSLVYLSQSDLMNELQSKGILNQHDSFIITEEINSNIDNFIKFINQAGQDNFTKLWISFSSFLATVNNLEYWNMLVSQVNINFYGKLKDFLLNSSILVEEKVINSLELSQNIDVIVAINLVQKDFKDILRYTGAFIEECENDKYNSPNSWSIQYAGKFLIENSPQVFLEVISHLYTNFKDENSTNWINASILFYLIKQLGQEIIYISIGNQTNQILLDLLPSSDIPLIRAIGTQSLWFSLNSKKINLEFASSIITKLNSIEEQVYSLAEWVYALRMQAQNNHQEKPAQEILRKQIYAHICQLWQPDFSQETMLGDIIRRLSGLIEGSWAVSNNHDLLLPLLNAEKLNLDNVVKLWFDMLLKRLKVNLGQEMPENIKPLDYPYDLEIIEICSWSLINTSVDNRDKYLKEINKEIFKPCQRILQKPFSRSHNYHAWFKAVVLLLWLGIFYKFCLNKGDFGADNESLNQLQQKTQYIEELIKKINFLTINPLDITQAIKNYYLYL
ncbi:VPA1262 family protein [Trichormus variabilis]|uniref:Uncharacterized protein n=1 Tax=Trichormus variabilis SAG 1403-4b TaxID=447716 RepID=A0A3S1A645_ANAVA|nr:VPA1262 family protein [Trichormus variabilis]MBD2628759.1 hypothetical protein [Trichormus variabilis FACHB-164]RUS94086.1 hypothetical protein DSM107003_39730 [Trichormus variabilis SAG 1403-4b]